MSTTSSSNRDEIYGCISRVMGKIGAVAKEGENKAQSYKFRGIDQFYNAAHPAMVSEGVFCAPAVLEYNSEAFETTKVYNGEEKVTRTFHALLKVNHRFYAPDGSYVDVVTCGEGLDTSDKAVNKAMSAAMKYALIELFAVPTADVAEADKESPEAEGEKKPSGQVKTYTRPGAVKAEADALLKAIPAAKEPETEFLRADQMDHLRLKFKDALPIAYQTHSDQMRREALKDLGYVGEDGNGTSKLVLQSDFKNVLRKLIVAAKKVGDAPAAVGGEPITDSDVPF